MTRTVPARLAALGRGVRRAAEALVVALFSLIVTVFAASIASRYLLNRPLPWADEVLVLLMAWCAFLAGALVLEEREQVVFDLLYARLPARGRRVVVGVGSLLLASALAAALPGIGSYTLFLWRERTNVLEMRLDVAYACFGLFIVALVVRRLWLLATLLGPGWRDALGRLEGAPAPAAAEAERGP